MFANARIIVLPNRQMNQYSLRTHSAIPHFNWYLVVCVFFLILLFSLLSRSYFMSEWRVPKTSENDVNSQGSGIK